ncbi:MAG TPA: family 43 glycosylhydrolase [Acidobacteriaceae bacterium]
MNSIVVRLGVLGVVLSVVVGCGGSSSGTSSVVTPPATTPDMGTATAMLDGVGYTITNVSSGALLGIAGQSQTAGAALNLAASDAGADQLWHVMPMGNNQYNVENMLTHQVMGVTNASTAASAASVQWADNGTPDHLWTFFQLQDGNFLIQNGNSKLYLEDEGSSTNPAAVVDQNARATTGTGCSCQEWKVVSNATSPYPAPAAVTGNGIFVHDPYMLKDASGTYWLYGTHQTLAYSTDMKTFTYTNTNSALGACTTTQGGDWITADNRCPIIGPDFSTWAGLQTPKSDNSGQNTDVWAPSLMVQNGTYYQYYSVPYEPSTGAEAVIGLATSASPAGPWTDKGYVVSSWTNTTTTPPATGNIWNFSATTTWNAIDPAPFVDATGKWWMSFGSWSDGIHLMQLDPATGMPLASNPTPYPVIAARGNSGEEGSFIYPWMVNGTQYYYYFAPINVCCAGTASTYRMIVGRATSPQGPYLDRGGLDLKNGGGTILMSSHGSVYGPGGQSVFTDMVSGVATPTLVYHYYDGNNNGTPTLGINRLGFTTDGWPVVQ